MLFNLYTPLLATLMVCRQWRERDLRRLEPWLQSTTWLTAILSALLPLRYGWYRPTPHFCWIFGPDLVEVLYTTIPMWPCIVGAALYFVAIYRYVKTIENRSFRHDFGSSAIAAPASSSSSISSNHIHPNNECRNRHRFVTNAMTRKSQQVAQRALWLVASFLFTYSLDLVRVIWWYTRHESPDWFVLWVLTVFPMQGFFNSLAYVWSHPQLYTHQGQWLRRVVLRGAAMFTRNSNDITDGVFNEGTRSRPGEANGTERVLLEMKYFFSDAEELELIEDNDEEEGDEANHCPDTYGCHGDEIQNHVSDSSPIHDASEDEMKAVRCNRQQTR